MRQPREPESALGQAVGLVGCWGIVIAAVVAGLALLVMGVWWLIARLG